MGSIARFAAYAAAFEKAFQSDDWSEVEPFFTEDAVYHVTGPPPWGGTHQGRAAVLAGLKRSLDTLDRRFDARDLQVLEGPLEKEGAVWLRWGGAYRLGGAPDLEVEGEEWAWFEGDRIRRLEDRIPDACHERTAAWLERHGDKLG